MANRYRPSDPLVRFWAAVTKTPTCWLWTASTRKGYGGFRAFGRIVQSHRFAYEHFRGPIPPGLTVDHLCRVKRCVNPDHLEVVTNRVNVLRGIGRSATNARKTQCKYGHAFTRENTWRDARGKRQCRTCWHDRRPASARATEATA